MFGATARCDAAVAEAKKAGHQLKQMLADAGALTAAEESKRRAGEMALILARLAQLEEVRTSTHTPRELFGSL